MYLLCVCFALVVGVVLVLVLVLVAVVFVLVFVFCQGLALCHPTRSYFGKRLSSQTWPWPLNAMHQ